MIDVREALKEIVEKLDGVTAGPWIQSGVRQNINANCIMVGPENFLIVAVPCGANDHASALRDARHIARCDPDTMRAIAQLVKELDRQLESHIAEGIEATRFITKLRKENEALQKIREQYKQELWNVSGKEAWFDKEDDHHDSDG